MHLCDLGIFKKLVKYTFTDSKKAVHGHIRRKALYKADHYNILMDRTKVCSELGRAARGFDQIGSMKAVEYRNVGLFYFPVID